ncbi:efflux RND transporter permease subunit [Micrococcaceae bacterium Sec5.7]
MSSSCRWWVDPDQLKANGLTLDEVIRTTGNAVWVSPLSYLEASTPGTGGFIETGNQRLGVQRELLITTPKDLAQLSLNAGGRPVALGDVAQVLSDHQPLIGDAVIGDDPGLLLVIGKFPDTNTLEVTRSIDERQPAARTRSS